MDATPIDFVDARSLDGLRPPVGIDSLLPSSTAARAELWATIHGAAATVGAIAGVDQHRITTEIHFGLSAELPSADMPDQAIQDLADTLRRGISALLTAHLNGGAPQAAALTLWKEFLSARAMVLWPGMTRDTSGTHL